LREGKIGRYEGKKKNYQPTPASAPKKKDLGKKEKHWLEEGTRKRVSEGELEGEKLRKRRTKKTEKGTQSSRKPTKRGKL